MPAPKGNTNAKGNPGGGRPQKYKAEFAEWAEKLSKLGATDEEMSDAFGVSVTTFNKWKHAHVEFSVALKNGKAFADANVADRLYQRAMGFEHPEVDIKMYEGNIIKTDITKRYPPDTTAAIFWLKNRQRDKWRDRHESDITSNGETLAPKIVSEITPRVTTQTETT